MGLRACGRPQNVRALHGARVGARRIYNHARSRLASGAHGPPSQGSPAAILAGQATVCVCVIAWPTTTHQRARAPNGGGHWRDRRRDT
jgi:hypothetical protein